MLEFVGNTLVNMAIGFAVFALRDHGKYGKLRYTKNPYAVGLIVMVGLIASYLHPWPFR